MGRYCKLPHLFYLSNRNNKMAVTVVNSDPEFSKISSSICFKRLPFMSLFLTSVVTNEY